MLKLNVPYNKPSVERVKRVAEASGVTVKQASITLSNAAYHNAVNDKLDRLIKTLSDNSPVNPAVTQRILIEVLTLLKPPTE